MNFIRKTLLFLGLLSSSLSYSYCNQTTFDFGVQPHQELDTLCQYDLVCNLSAPPCVCDQLLYDKLQLYTPQHQEEMRMKEQLLGTIGNTCSSLDPIHTYFVPSPPYYLTLYRKQQTCGDLYIQYHNDTNVHVALLDEQDYELFRRGNLDPPRLLSPPLVPWNQTHHIIFQREGNETTQLTLRWILVDVPSSKSPEAEPNRNIGKYEEIFTITVASLASANILIIIILILVCCRLRGCL